MGTRSNFYLCMTLITWKGQHTCANKKNQSGQWCSCGDIRKKSVAFSDNNVKQCIACQLNKANYTICEHTLLGAILSMCGHVSICVIKLARYQLYEMEMPFALNEADVSTIFCPHLMHC